MEGSTGLMEARVRRDPGTIRLTQVGLMIAAIGALLIVFDFFGLATLGLVMTVIGALLAARGGFGTSWYTAVAAGAALAVISRLLAESSETLGGWLAVIATFMILAGVSLGYPTASDDPE